MSPKNDARAEKLFVDLFHDRCVPPMVGKVGLLFQAFLEHDVVLNSLLLSTLSLRQFLKLGLFCMHFQFSTLAPTVKPLKKI